MVENNPQAVVKRESQVNATEMSTRELPDEIIKKIIAITERGNDATVKRKKDGYKVYEIKLVEK